MGVSTAGSAEILFSCRPPCLENEKAGSIRDRMFQPHSAGKELHQLHFLQVVQSLWKAAQVLNTSARYTIKMREKQKEMICHKNIPMQHVSVTTLNVTKTLHIANINGCSPSSALACLKFWIQICPFLPRLRMWRSQLLVPGNSDGEIWRGEEKGYGMVGHGVCNISI